MKNVTINIKRFSPRSRAGSIGYALSGIRALLRTEPNIWIHIAATIGVVIAGMFRQLTDNQWIAITVAIAMVWVAEALNTAVEKLCDFACDKKYYPEIKTIKDISAGAVLITSLCSIVIAIIVFI